RRVLFRSVRIRDQAAVDRLPSCSRLRGRPPHPAAVRRALYRNLGYGRSPLGLSPSISRVDAGISAGGTRTARHTPATEVRMRTRTLLLLLALIGIAV